MKKVLMICYLFPPIGGSGTQRSSKFVKYLPRHGWQPTVISGIDYGWPQDPTLLADIPPTVEAHRFPLPQSAWRRVRNWMFAHRIGPVGLGRIAYYAGWFLDFPDTKREWADAAAELALRLAGTEQFDAIYTTSPPYSPCVAARRVKKKLGLPWVADFRDPWSREDIEFGRLPGWMRKRHAAAERDTVTNADAVVCAHAALADFFADEYGVPRERCHAIGNGFDPDDFQNPPPAKEGPRHRIVITHTGTFARTYCPDALARALAEHWSGPPEGVKDVEFRFIGGVADTVFQKRPGLTVTITDRVDHVTALKEQAQADIVLTTFDRRVYGGNVSGKLFEYLACGRPILGVLPSDGVMAGIIRECSAGWVADCDDPRQIMEVLRHAVTRVARGDFSFDPDKGKISQFSRKELTGKLASVFDRVSLCSPRLRGEMSI